MPELPSVCVIGAGSSGIAAREGAARARDPVRLLREVRPRRRQLGLRQHERHVLGLPLAAHQHLARADGVRRLPDAEVVSRLPAPHARSPRYFDAYVDHFGFRDRIRFETGVEHAAREADGTWTIALDTGRDAPLRRAGRRQRPPLGPALARAAVPRQLRRRADARAPLHRQRAVQRGKTRRRASGWATARWTSRSSRASSPSDVLPRRATRRARHPEVPVRPAARPDRRQPLTGALPWAFRKRIFDERSCSVGVGRHGGLRAAEARPRPRRRAPDDLRRLPQPHRPRRDRAQAEHRRAEGDRVRFADGIGRAGRRRRLLHRLQGHVPVLRPGASSARPTTTCRCSGASSTRTSTTSSSSACCSRSARSCRSPRRRGGGSRRTCAASTRCRPAASCARDMERERAAMFKRYVASKRHTMQVDFDDYLYALGRERRARRAARARAGFRLPVAGRARRRQLPRMTPARAPASASARRPQNRRAILDAAQRGVRRAGLRRGGVRDIVRRTDLALGHVLQLLPRQGVGLPRGARGAHDRAAPPPARGARARARRRDDRARGLPRRTSRSSSRTGRCSRCCAATPARCASCSTRPRSSAGSSSCWRTSRAGGARRAARRARPRRARGGDGRRRVRARDPPQRAGSAGRRARPPASPASCSSAGWSGSRSRAAVDSCLSPGARAE